MYSGNSIPSKRHETPKVEEIEMSKFSTNPLKYSTLPNTIQNTTTQNFVQISFDPRNRFNSFNPNSENEEEEEELQAQYIGEHHVGRSFGNSFSHSPKGIPKSNFTSLYNYLFKIIFVALVGLAVVSMIIGAMAFLKAEKLENLYDTGQCPKPCADGPQGIQGIPGTCPQSCQNGSEINITIGNTTTLPPGSQSYVIDVGTHLNPILEFGISSGGIVGPQTSIVGNLAYWNIHNGTSLADSGVAYTNIMTLTGDQIINGSKIFSGTTSFGNNSATFTSLVNQIVIQPGNVGNSFTLTASNPSINLIYTIPDVGFNSSFLMSSSIPPTSGNLVEFGSNVNVLVDSGFSISDFVTLTGVQSISGVKTFSVAPILTSTLNQLLIQPGGSGNSFTINATNPSISLTYNIPDVGSTASFVMTTALTSGNIAMFSGTKQNLIVDSGITPSTILTTNTAQSVSGSKTFSVAPIFTTSTNQLILQPGGTGNSITLNAITPTTTSLIYSMSDVGTSASFVMTTATSSGNFAAFSGIKQNLLVDSGIAPNGIMSTTSTQTISGVKTFSVAPILAAPTRQLVIQPSGSGNNFTISAATNPTSNVTYTIFDVGSNAGFVMTTATVSGNIAAFSGSKQNLLVDSGIVPNTIVTTTSTQTISGPKTFTSAPLLTTATNQLIFQPGGTGNSITFNAVNPATTSLIYSISDVGTSASFVLTTATSSGNLVAFSGTKQNLLVDSGIAPTSIMSTTSTQTISGVKTFSVAPILTAPTRQLVIQPSGSGNNFTISATTNPTSNLTYTISDVGSNAGFVMTTATANGNLVAFSATTQNLLIDSGMATSNIVTLSGSQTVSGTKIFSSSNTFTSSTYFTSLTNQIVIQSGGSGNTFNITVPGNPATSLLYSIPDVGASSTFAMMGTTAANGNLVAFSTSKSNLLVDSGVIPASLVVLSGAQTISGQKTFSISPIMSSGCQFTGASSQMTIQPGGGTGKSFIISAPSNPVSDVVYGITDVGVNANFTMTTATASGNIVAFSGTKQNLLVDSGIVPSTIVTTTSSQTISGAKTFSGVNNAFLNQVAFKSGSNQLAIIPGAGNAYVLSASSSPAATVVYQITDVGMNANFTMTTATASGNIVAFSGTKQNLLVDSGINPTTIITTTSSQTISGSKIFSVTPTLTATTNQLIIQPGGTGTSFTINATNPISSSTYNIPDVGSSTASFVMSLPIAPGGVAGYLAMIDRGRPNVMFDSAIDSSTLMFLSGSQTVTGSKTFSTSFTLTPSNNQIWIQPGGVGGSFIINAPGSPSSNVAYGITDVGVNANFTMTTATASGNVVAFSGTKQNLLVDSGIDPTTIVTTTTTQTITSQKTFSNYLILGAGVNQMWIRPGGTGFSYVITASANPSTNRYYNLQDVGSNAGIVVTQSTATGNVAAFSPSQPNLIVNTGISPNQITTFSTTAPVSSTSTCTTGAIVVDASYFYMCVATNTWRRVAVSTF